MEIEESLGVDDLTNLSMDGLANLSLDETSQPLSTNISSEPPRGEIKAIGRKECLHHDESPSSSGKLLNLNFRS